MDPVRSRRFALPGIAAAVLVVAAAWLLAAAPVGAITYPSSPPAMTTPAPATSAPSATTAPVAAPSSLQLGVGTNATLGSFLTGPSGMTLYTLSSDPNGGSICTGQCLAFWPPLLVASGGSIAGPSTATGTFSTFTRTDDGTTQVTYNGRALYYFKNDAATGDVNGEGIKALGGVWHVAGLAASTTGGSAVVKLGERSTSLGTVLTGPNGMTLYTLSSDPTSGTICTGQCLTFWPALTVATGGKVTAPSSVKGTFAWFKRSDDGTNQVTLNGRALYFFKNDSKPGDVNGEGIKNTGGVWHVVKITAGAVRGATGSPASTLPVTATATDGQATSGTLLPLLLLAFGGVAAALVAARPRAGTIRNR